MKKKLLLCLFSIVMCFSLFGCGVKKETQTYVSKIEGLFTIKITFNLENDKVVSATIDNTFESSNAKLIDSTVESFKKNEIYKDVTKKENTIHASYSEKGLSPYKNLNKQDLQEAMESANYTLETE